MSKRILIVEDDDELARLLVDNLTFQKFVVERVATAIEAPHALKHFKPEVVLLDLMLGSADGFDVCRILAAQRERPAIIIVSAKSGQNDKIRGLDLGADDYVTKPFAFHELLARIRAVSRRRSSSHRVLMLGQVKVDFDARRATRGGRDLGLTDRELEVLQYLADRPRLLIPRDELLEEVWGYRDLPLTRSVDISVARLRRKIEPDPHRPRYLRTVHGEGYRLTPEG